MIDTRKELSAWAVEIHNNAVEHGWWENPGTADDLAKLNLIQREWSEATEELRDGQPEAYCNSECEIRAHGSACSEVCAVVCGFRDGKAKPEGYLVELMDGVIRILDLLAAWDCLEAADVMPELPSFMKRPMSDMELIGALHQMTSSASCTKPEPLAAAAYLVLTQLDMRGIDGERIMAAKHRYNKLRPYRHGGKAF